MTAKGQKQERGRGPARDPNPLGRKEAGQRRKERTGSATYRYEQGTRVTAWCYRCDSPHRWDECEIAQKEEEHARSGGDRPGRRLDDLAILGEIARKMNEDGRRDQR